LKTNFTLEKENKNAPVEDENELNPRLFHSPESLFMQDF
jgi:hypothetical protein